MNFSADKVDQRSAQLLSALFTRRFSKTFKEAGKKRPGQGKHGSQPKEVFVVRGRELANIGPDFSSNGALCLFQVR